jgi:hypothetical protein
MHFAERMKPWNMIVLITSNEFEAQDKSTATRTKSFIQNIPQKTQYQRDFTQGGILSTLGIKSDLKDDKLLIKYQPTQKTFNKLSPNAKEKFLVYRNYDSSFLQIDSTLKLGTNSKGKKVKKLQKEIGSSLNVKSKEEYIDEECK